MATCPSFPVSSEGMRYLEGAWTILPILVLCAGGDDDPVMFNVHLLIIHSREKRRNRNNIRNNISFPTKVRKTDVVTCRSGFYHGKEAQSSRVAGGESRRPNHPGCPIDVFEKRRRGPELGLGPRLGLGARATPRSTAIPDLASHDSNQRNKTTGMFIRVY